MKEMLKNTLILLIITVVAGALLGVVNENTKGIIAQREAEDKKDKLDSIVIDLREKQRKIKDRIKVNKY